MTIPNIITIIRIALIPCFVIAFVYYTQGFKDGEPIEWEYWCAVGLFAVATSTDALDGYLARRLNQKSRLGSVLDPIADKALLITALLLLSWNHGNAFPHLPFWFPIVVLSRDIIVVLGVAIVFMMGREFEVQPHWIGKVAAVLQMVTIGMFLLRLPEAYWEIPLWAAGISTVISGAIYVVQGARKMA
jgi:CDP-diacylglycerol--glycerol-3-phosphate 3-phosphatidyltransferase